MTWPKVWPNRQHWHRGVAKDFLSHRSEKDLGEPASPVGSDNHQVGMIAARALQQFIRSRPFQQLRAKGLSITEAAIAAAKIRLRPILMTSFAFILGVLPLVFATGAGSASRNSVGTTVFGGMIVSTVLNLFFIPLLYVIVKSTLERKSAVRG